MTTLSSGLVQPGCVLANRLSTDPSTNVLLLEAGPEDSAPEIHIPGGWPGLLGGPLDWNYATEPEPALAGRRVTWPRGKVLGGSSSLNAMVYIRGNRFDYDYWDSLGNDGWSFDDVLPYFLKAEHQQRGASKYHGVGGPLHVSDLRTVNPLTRAFLDACARIGIPPNTDFNAEEQFGVGLNQVTQKDGRRCSTAAAYLVPIRSRSNLTVETGSQATRVIFRVTRAVGVEYISEGRTTKAEASREVIIAAGAIESPRLLLLSGVGPARELEAFAIPVIADLRGVGQTYRIIQLYA